MLKYLKRGPGFYGYLWRLTGRQHIPALMFAD